MTPAPKELERQIRIYRALLRILPTELYDEAADEITAIFEDQLREEVEQRRPLGSARVWARAVVDLLVVAIASRSPARRTFASVGLTQDLHFAARSLRRRPGFNAVAIGTLALGIGGATAVFTVVDGVLLRALPYDDPESLVSVWKAWPEWRDDPDLSAYWDRIQFPLDDYLAVRDGTTALADVAAYGASRVVVSGAGDTRVATVGEASANLLPMLGVEPAVGRLFNPSEVADRGPGARVALLSHELWARTFGGSESVLGSSIRLDGHPYEIIGVLPADFRLASEIEASSRGEVDDGQRDVWVPLLTIEKPRDHDFEVIARLEQGRTAEQAATEITPLLTRGRTEQFARVLSRKSVVVEGFGAPIALLFAGALVLLLIACTNVTGLLLGRAIQRHREIAVRSALGASRGRITRQLLTESGLMGLLGAAAAIAFALLGTEALIGWAPPMPRLEEVRVDLRVFAFAMAVGGGSGVLFGLLPGLVSSGSVGTALRTRNRGHGLIRLQRAVVAVQVTLTVVLLLTGGLFSRTLFALMDQDPGFSAEEVFAFTVTTPIDIRERSGEWPTFFADVLGAVEGTPGVVAVGATTDLPFPGVCCENSMQVDGWEGPVDATHHVRRVSAAYTETMGIPLLDGRRLGAGDSDARPVPAIVSASFAAMHWGERSALGRAISWDGERDLIVVGVVGDVLQRRLGDAAEPTLYLPHGYRPRPEMSVVLRVAGDASEPLAATRLAIVDAHPAAPIGPVSSVPSLMRDSEADARFRALLMSVFALLAAALSAIGVFGVTAQTVALRRRELGIRNALGASSSRLVADLMREGVPYLGAGVAVGLVLALGVATVVRHLLFGVAPTDLSTYAAVAVAIGGIASLAVAIPAQRVAQIAPMEVMSAE